jgi:hypothetical protein
MTYSSLEQVAALTHVGVQDPLLSKQKRRECMEFMLWEALNWRRMPLAFQ